MVKRVILAATLLMLSLPVHAIAAESGQGIVEGRLVNGTAGGSSVVDQEVTLKTFQNGSESDSATSRTDANGYFAFDGLATSTSFAYQITLIYQEAEYSSAEIGFESDETDKYIEVLVYDATTVADAIKVATAHTIVYTYEGSLEVIEYYLIINESDHTYIGTGEITATGKRQTFSFPLPSKATGLQYGSEIMECCVLETSNGFADTMPILPGGKEIIFSYQLANNSDTYKFTKDISAPTDSYDILIQGEGIQVTSDQMTPGEPITFEGMSFTRLSGRDLGSNDSILVQISGLPKSSSSNAMQWVFGTLAVLLGGVGVRYFTRRRGLQPVKPANNAQQKQRLLAEIAQLDDDFESGKVPEEEYRRLRIIKKSLLVESMQDQKEESSKG